jgi:hypothetical protein
MIRKNRPLKDECYQTRYHNLNQMTLQEAWDRAIKLDPVLPKTYPFSGSESVLRGALERAVINLARRVAELIGDGVSNEEME